MAGTDTPRSWPCQLLVRPSCASRARACPACGSQVRAPEVCQQLDGDTCGAAQQEEHVVGTVSGPGKATSTAEGGCTSGCTSGWCTRCDSVPGAVILGHTPLGVPTMCFCVGDRRLRVSIHAVHAAAHGVCGTSGSRHAVLVCAPTPAAAAAASAGGSTTGPAGARDMDSQRLELAVVSQDGGGGGGGSGGGGGAIVRGRERARAPG